MLELRSSGSRPAPSVGAGLVVRLNGESKKTSNVVKNAPKPSRTLVAYGTTSRSRLRVMRIATLAQIESSHTHSSSEPSCEDHRAATRYRSGVVVLEVSATVL